MPKSTDRRQRMSDLLRAPAGPIDLGLYDTRATPGFDGDKAAGEAALADVGLRLSELQERLYAAGTKGDPRRILLVLQGTGRRTRTS